MNILLTGGCGFIGSNFVRFIMRHRPDWKLTNLDALAYSGNPDNLADIEGDEHYRFVHGNILDPGLTQRLITEADAVVHMAAESHVDRSIEDARPFVETNVLGTQTLLDAMRRADPKGAKRFVHISTDEVFGDLPIENPELQFTETMPYAPSSPYSASKAASDMLVKAYHHTFGMNTVITNCSNNHGPYQFPEKVIPVFVTKLMNDEKIPLYGDGRNVRDWLHVDDHCEAILAVLERGTSGESYCIGGNNERSNLELTHTILEIMGKDESSIEKVADRLGHDRRYAIDATKLERELGWKPTRSAWPEAMQNTVNWYTNNKRWCERVISGAYQDGIVQANA